MNYQFWPWRNLVSWMNNSCLVSMQLEQGCKKKNCCVTSSQQTASRSDPSEDGKDKVIKLETFFDAQLRHPIPEFNCCVNKNILNTHIHTAWISVDMPEDTNICQWDLQEMEGLRVFTFGGEIEHAATVEPWGCPGGVGDVQQRGTAFSLDFSPSQGRNTTPGLKQKKKRQLQTQATVDLILPISLEGLFSWQKAWLIGI